VVLLATSAIFQAVVYFHGLQAAHLAANQGLFAAEATDGTAQAGTSRATDVLAQLGNPLSAPSVNASRGPETATVTVTGSVAELVPGLALHISVVSRGPVEVFQAESVP